MGCGDQARGKWRGEVSDLCSSPGKKQWPVGCILAVELVKSHILDLFGKYGFLKDWLWFMGERRKGRHKGIWPMQPE